jgi:hypothetical protein
MLSIGRWGNVIVAIRSTVGIVLEYFCEYLSGNSDLETGGVDRNLLVDFV